VIKQKRINIQQIPVFMLCIMSFALVLWPLAVEAHARPERRSFPNARHSHSDEDNDSFWKMELWYAQTPGLWDSISELKKKSYTLPEIDRLLQDQFNRPDEGMARFSLRYYGENRGGLGTWTSHGYVGARGDLLVGGVAKNRIFPSVQGYKALSTQLEFGLADNPNENDPEKIWSTQWGSVLGVGNQELIDGLAIDLYPKPPIEKTNLFFWGLDLQLGYHGIFNEALRAENKVAFQPTFFHSDTPDADYAYQVHRRDVRWRWRAETEWWIALVSPALEFSLLAVGGQQPVPIPFLPRVWDSIHEIKPFPAPGQLIGLGSGLSLHSDDFRYSGTAHAGIFGGYLGATFQLRLKWFEAGVGTVGFEQSSGYRVTESRIKYAQIGVRHEF